MDSGSLTLIFPYFLTMDTENVLSFLALIVLLTFFYFAFGRLVEQSEKRNDHRLGYINFMAA